MSAKSTAWEVPALWSSFISDIQAGSHFSLVFLISTLDTPNFYDSKIIFSAHNFIRFQVGES